MAVNKKLKHYVSYTQLELLLRDPEEYEKRYVLGLKEEPTEAMTFGKIFQRAWADRTFNYARACAREGLTSDKARIIKTALAQPGIIRVSYKQADESGMTKVLLEHEPINLMANFDGVIEKEMTIIENKTGHPWGQDRVEESLQLTMYAYVAHKKFNWPLDKMKIVLQSFDGYNGKMRQFVTTRSKVDFDDLLDKIQYFYEETIRRGWRKE